MEGFSAVSAGFLFIFLIWCDCLLIQDIFREKIYVYYIICFDINNSTKRARVTLVCVAISVDMIEGNFISVCDNLLVHTSFGNFALCASQIVTSFWPRHLTQSRSSKMTDCDKNEKEE